jgi:O-antigen/teichoic acid export membrane protein
MAKGATWMVAIKLTERLLGLVNTMVLARLLVPEDFGLVSLAASLWALLEIMGAFSFDLALIHNQRAAREHYDTAWTLGLLYGLVSATLLAVGAHAASRYFSDARLEGVLYIFAACALIQSCKNIGVIAFQKDLNFRREFVYAISVKVSTIAGTLVIAVTLRSFWALAIGTFIGTTSNVIISYILHPFRPRLAISKWRALMRFSGWVLFSNIMIFAGNRGYDLVIGRMAGPGALGLYSVAYEISNLPTTEIVWPASKALFPGFSKIREDENGLREAFLRTAAIVALFTIPAGAGVALLAEPIVRILLGPKWLPAVPTIQVLALFGTLRALHAGTGALYLALGKTRLVALIATPHVIIGLPLATILLAEYGIRGAGFAVLLSGAIALAMTFIIVKGIMSLTLRQLAGCFWRPFLATCMMAAAVYQLNVRIPPNAMFFWLVGATAGIVLAAVVLYATVTLLLWQWAGRPPGAEQIVVERLRSRLKKTTAPIAPDPLR